MELRQNARKVVGRLRATVDHLKYRDIAARYDIAGYRRVYLVHIRKTGGTSLNHAFLGLSGENSADVYDRLAKKSDHRILCGDKVYVGWNTRYINGGKYFYAFSHTPLHELKLPEKTFTITCFRDPIKRVISHYNMLIHFSVNGIPHPCMRVEGDWLGASFDDFLQRIPRKHLHNQLYMFSPRYDINEAVDRVASSISHCFFSEAYDRGVEALTLKTRLPLKSVHVRKARCQAPISDRAMTKLRDMVEIEYSFLEKVRNLCS